MNSETRGKLAIVVGVIMIIAILGFVFFGGPIASLGAGLSLAIGGMIVFGLVAFHVDPDDHH
ncbi:hypothetical protein A3K29_04540 [Candidatus Collierbacteria bacterium RIFOXYB2_FULL_46_14]|nr:MAG: hypothetical protein A3K29_04540 [Candidatus Collierbacteria bacterium RIFOXYB2_FULL_46_14]OGD76410.1 MAG: hypothetical protein A3K43_04540 [Candidatus Collierbacteria bacterium RIFOXYA2_FULL_46_20]OGD77746.1 MAG: hypothetical protein A3K39_04540 [Candidatus Collierbacteria bacterium RIFOXYC2_FULL_43_15]OGD81036.1 MAG: hypothetical protein A2320_05035 [Pseudomonadales bacterium GWC2_63_15]OGD82468.1 MAG: hypothetical protein A3K36_04540 [Candidatus Collierbacteria bacterium RIFOXYD2_FUL